MSQVTEQSVQFQRTLASIMFSRGSDVYDFFFFQAEDGIRDLIVTGVQTCALPIYGGEYITRVRTKGFVIATIGIPLLTAGLMGGSIYLAVRENTRTMKIAILDDAGGFAESIAKGLDKKLPNGLPAFQVVKKIERPTSEKNARKDL